MSKTIHISIYQMSVSPYERNNVEKIKTAAKEAQLRGCDLLILPELWNNGDALEKAVRSATPLGSGVFGELASLAKQHHLCLYGSSFFLDQDGKVSNTAVFFGSDGVPLGVYSKIHLFKLMKEDKFFSAGNKLVMVDAGWAKIGLSICYDLRFPEMYRAYALAGAEVVLVCAAWPHPRLSHWQTLLRARAIENQYFIAACNRTGTNGNLEFFGNSCVLDAWGEAILQTDDKEGLYTTSINLEELYQVRAKMPVFEDRNPMAYTI